MFIRTGLLSINAPGLIKLWKKKGIIKMEKTAETVKKVQNLFANGSNTLLYELHRLEICHTTEEKLFKTMSSVVNNFQKELNEVMSDE
jgi:hypothetical protein